MKLCECGCGREVTNEKNKFINKHNKPWKILVGKKQSKETIEKRNTALKQVIHSDEWNNKVSKSLSGRVITWNQKMSVAHRVRNFRIIINSI